MGKYSFRWGVDILDEKKPAHVPVYRFMLRNYAKAGVTRDEFLCIIHLADYHYESENGKATPGLKTIALQMGYSHENSVRNLIKSLQGKKMVEVIHHSGFTSEYIFGGFSQKMLDLWNEVKTDIPLHPNVVPPSHPNVGVPLQGNVPEEEETKKKKPKKKKEGGTSATPPAISAYREVAKCYPNKELYEKIATAIGESPEALEKWQAHILDWISRGWNPRNIKGLLETWAKGGIEPRQQSANAKRPQPYTPPTEADYEAMAQQNAEYEAYAAAQNTPPQPATAAPALHTFASGKTPAQVWHGALETLRGQLQQATFDTWLGGSRYHGFEDGVLIIQVQSENARQWLEKRLNTKVARALELWAGETVAVRYIVNGGD